MAASQNMGRRLIAASNESRIVESARAETAAIYSSDSRAFVTLALQALGIGIRPRVARRRPAVA